MIHVAPYYFDLTLNCCFQDLQVYKHDFICIIFLLIPLIYMYVAVHQSAQCIVSVFYDVSVI